MNESVKPSVEQEKTVQKKSKTSSDKKSAKGTEVFYSSVAYLQSSEILKDIDNLRKRVHTNPLYKIKEINFCVKTKDMQLFTIALLVVLMRCIVKCQNPF